MRARQIFPSKTSALLLGCLAAAIAAPRAPAWAITTRMTEIHVSLFGQPCLLEGPLDERGLKTIHSLSPEQLYPARTSFPTSEPTRRALEKTRSLTAIPVVLDRYRERLTKRLEAQLAFMETLESFSKTRKSPPVRAVGKKYLTGKHWREFETQLKKTEAMREVNSERGRDALDQLLDAFNDGIEPDPEEEFHRAIHRMNVQYTCSFEESSEGKGNDSD
jgi:hypothetical protein